MKRYVMMIAAVTLAAAVSANAQQKPSTAADRAKAAAEKAAAEQKAGEDNMARMAAQQAEAVARAQLKVAEEAARAAEKAALAAKAKDNEVIPVDIEVVVSRYQADKKISSLPYSLAVNVGGETSLRMGANVPVPASIFSSAASEGKPAPLVSYNYQNVGTDIDVQVRGPLGDGRFTVRVKVEERSVVQQPGTASTSSAPVIRNFAAENSFVLRDGQTRQFTAAADRVTGEIVKVDVTLKVAK